MLLDLDLKDNIPVSLKISTLKTTGVKTVLMSTYSEPALVREALAAGALGYLVKSEEAGMIVEAIRAAYNGESYISAELDLALNAGAEGDSPRLSAQERRVMALYGAGEPVKAVAYQLGISEGALLLSLAPHALPELTMLFLPLAAWMIASRARNWNELLAATFVTVAIAVPVIMASAAVELLVSPRLLESITG